MNWVGVRVGLGWEVNLEDGGGVQTQLVLWNSAPVVILSRCHASLFLRHDVKTPRARGRSGLLPAPAAPTQLV